MRASIAAPLMYGRGKAGYLPSSTTGKGRQPADAMEAERFYSKAFVRRAADILNRRKPSTLTWGSSTP